MRHIALFFALLLFSCLLHAQEPSYNNYTTDDGLAHNEVYEILQDQQGNMWFTSDGGLNKFDGTDFTIYNNKNGLANNITIEIFEDAQGRIWTTTIDKKVWRLEGDTFIELLDLENIEATTTFHKAPTKETLIFNVSNMLVLTDDSVTQTIKPESDLSTRAVVTINDTVNLINHFTVSKIFKNSSNQMQLKIDSVKGDNELAENRSRSPVGISAKKVKLLNDEMILVITPNHIGEYANLTINTIFKTNQFIIRDAATLGDKIWLSTNQGIKCVDPKSGKIVRSYFNDIQCYSIYTDKENNVWFGTLSNGIFMLPNIGINHITKLHNASSGQISALLSTNNFLLVGENNGAASKLFNMDNITPLNTKGYTKSRIRAFQLNQNKNQIYTAGDFGIIKTKNNSEIEFEKTSLIRNSGVSVKNFKIAEEKLVYATGNTVFVHNSYSKENTTASNEKILIKRSYAMHNVNNEIIYIGAIDGLYEYRINVDSVAKLININGLNGNNVTDITHDQSGVLWVSTEGKGVFGIYNYEVKYHFDDDLLKTSNARCLLSLDSFLYVGTDKGFVKINKQNKTINYHLNKDNGLRSNFVNCIDTFENNIYIGTNLGLTIIDESRLTFSETGPKIYVRNVETNGSAVDINKNHVFKSSIKSVQISFAHLYFKQKNNIEYRYKLNENQPFIYTNDNTLDLPYLDPGEYNFKVWASNSNGIWSEEPASFSFEIKPPFSKTIWFWLLIGLFILLLAYYVFHNRLSQAKNAEELKELELQALRTQMNPHFIFNALTSIQLLIAEKDEKSAQQYLTKFARLIRKILDQSNNKSISVKEEIETLSLYLQLEKLRFEDKFEYSLVDDKSVDLAYDKIPAMIIQPYIENAINHGIKPMKGNGSLEINVSKKDQMLICTVKDNGIGRKASEALKQSKSHHKSQGMDITEKRLNLLSKSKFGNIEIEDLYDQNNKASGTLVKLLIDLV